MEMSSLCRSRSQKWRFPKLLSLCWWSRVSKAGERLFGCTHEVWEGLQGLEHGIARRWQQFEQFITSLCPLTPPPPARCPPGRTVPCKTELLNPAVPLSTLLPPASSYCQPDWNITQTLNTGDGRTLWSGLEKYFHHIPTWVQLQ